MNSLQQSVNTSLTDKELAVFKLVAEGHENSYIATALGITTRTVETHRDHVNKKFSVNSVAPLVHLAVAAEMIEPAERTIIETLTNRELEVVVLIAEGYLNKEIADRLGIGVRTVETHRERAMRKFDCHNTAQMTRLALTLGIVDNRYKAEVVPEPISSGEPQLS
jgi:DNA-binding NarL/FixJ family response regulator